MIRSPNGFKGPKMTGGDPLCSGQGQRDDSRRQHREDHERTTLAKAAGAMGKR